MGSVCHEGSLLTPLSHSCSLDVEGKEWVSGPQLTFLLNRVLQVFAQTCAQCKAALTSWTAVKRQLPVSADTGWIWRLFFHDLYMAVLFLYFPPPAALVLTGKNSLLWHGTKETAATSNACFLLV